MTEPVSVTIIETPISVSIDDGTPQVTITDLTAQTVTVIDASPQITIGVDQQPRVVVNQGVGSAYDIVTLLRMLEGALTLTQMDTSLAADLTRAIDNSTVAGMLSTLTNSLTLSQFTPSLRSDIEKLQALWARIGIDPLLSEMEIEALLAEMQATLEGVITSAINELSITMDAQDVINANAISELDSTLTARVDLLDSSLTSGLALNLAEIRAIEASLNQDILDVYTEVDLRISNATTPIWSALDELVNWKDEFILYVEDTFGDHWAQILLTAEEIALQVGALEESIDGQLVTMNAAITLNAEQINLRVDRIETDLGEEIAAYTGLISITAYELSLLTSRVTTVENGLITAESSITLNADEILLRVSEIEDLDGRVITNTGNIGINSDLIALTVTRTDDIEDRVDAAEITISATEGIVSSMTTTIANQGYRLSATETLLSDQWGVVIQETAGGDYYSTGFGLIMYPAWLVDIAYVVNDRRTYDGSVYKCLISHTSTLALNPEDAPTYWELDTEGIRSEFTIQADKFKILTDAGPTAVFSVSGSTVNILGTLTIGPGSTGYDNLDDAPTSLADIDAAAALALNDATTAISYIEAWGEDDVFSPSEKKAMADGWHERHAEYLDVKYRAGLIGVSTSSLTSYFQAWGTYLNGGSTWSIPASTPMSDSQMPLWLKQANIESNTTVVRSTFTSVATNYFNALVACKNSISAGVDTAISSAANTAIWASVGGRPTTLGELDSTADALIEALGEQVDNKISIFVQATTPSSAAGSWSDANLNHIGDQWYKTTDQKWYEYNGSYWVLTDSSIADISTLAEGKTTTWYGSYTPGSSPTGAAIGDFFVKNSGGVITFYKKTGTSTWTVTGSFTDGADITDYTTINTAIAGKNKVFLETPTPPYIVGDLWYRGAKFGMWTCTTARSSGSFVFADFSPTVALDTARVNGIAAATVAANAADGKYLFDHQGDLAMLDQVDTVHIANGAIIAGKIASGSVEADKLHTNALSAAKAKFDSSTNASAAYSFNSGEWGTLTSPFSFKSASATVGLVCEKTNSGDGSAVFGYVSSTSSTGAGVAGYNKTRSSGAWGGFFLGEGNGLIGISNSKLYSGVIGQGYYGVRGYCTYSTLTNKYGLYTGNKCYAAEGFAPFTGTHLAFSKAKLEVGEIVSVTEAWCSDINQNVFFIDKTQKEKDSSVMGVVAAINPDVSKNFEENPLFSDLEDTQKRDGKRKLKTQYKVFIDNLVKEKYNEIAVNALGEGGILVCNENGDIQKGDYLCSANIKGYAKKQDDDLLHNYTIAKSAEDVVWSKEDKKTVKLIACTYHCG